MSLTESTTAKAFDYSASADLFSMTNRNGKRQPLSYKYFESAAEAIRYAIEEIPAQNLAGTILEADDTRYAGKEISGCMQTPAFRWQEGRPSRFDARDRALLCQIKTNEGAANMEIEDHKARRKIIRDFMALFADKRQTKEQAVAFVQKASQQNQFHRCRRDPDHQFRHNSYGKVLGWLVPRAGKA